VWQLLPVISKLSNFYAKPGQIQISPIVQVARPSMLLSPLETPPSQNSWWHSVLMCIWPMPAAGVLFITVHLVERVTWSNG
jgi:hypothetical protein